MAGAHKSDGAASAVGFVAASLPGPTDVVEVEAGQLSAVTRPEILVEMIVRSSR